MPAPGLSLSNGSPTAVDSDVRGRASLKRVVSDDDHPPSDIERLAARIRSGEYRSFKHLFDLYFEELVIVAKTYVGRHDVAEDLVQDVFFNIWRMHEEWHPQGRLRTYLYGAVRNHCLAYHRHQRVERRWEENAKEEKESGPAQPDMDYAYSELYREVQQAIGELPERRRLVFQLSRQRGLTYAEIAELLNISKNTVEVHMVRALKALRERLSPYMILAGLILLTVV